MRKLILAATAALALSTSALGNNNNNNTEKGDYPSDQSCRDWLRFDQLDDRTKGEWFGWLFGFVDGSSSIYMSEVLGWPKVNMHPSSSTVMPTLNGNITKFVDVYCQQHPDRLLGDAAAAYVFNALQENQAVIQVWKKHAPRN